MKRVFLPILLVLTVALTPISALADSWLCVAETSSGFNYKADRDEWIGANFRADEKYIVHQPGPDSVFARASWVVTEVGDAHPSYRCEEEFNEVGLLYCSYVGEFYFNRNTLRFLSVYAVGYVDGSEKKTGKAGDTPFMEIGKCSPL